jgi:Na+-driven multidrug efflux pump
MGVGFSLLPRLRAAPTVIERRRLIFHEAQLVGGIALLGSAAIFVLTPLVERWVLYGKYHLPASLVLAAIFSGVAKILNAFTKGVATALVDPRELSLVNLAGWVSVALSVVAGYFGARWGLAGVIYGVGLGWFLRAIVSLAVVVRHLRVPSGVPATAP